MEPKLTYKKEHSAGGVVYRLNNGQLEVVLFWTSFHPEKETWLLPKGWIDEGETSEQAAVREVQEEAGVTGEIEEIVDVIKYKYVLNGELVDKTVDFYLMKYVTGEPEDHGSEAHEARWFPIDEAIHKLDRSNEKAVLRKAKEVLTSKLSGGGR